MSISEGRKMIRVNDMPAKSKPLGFFTSSNPTRNFPNSKNYVTLADCKMSTISFSVYLPCNYRATETPTPPMEKWIMITWFVVMVTALRSLTPTAAASQGGHQYYSQLLIDCGTSTNTDYTTTNYGPAQWQADQQFIKHGQNRLLFPNQTTPQMNTLRFFPEGRKSCYDLLFFGTYDTRLFRAGFYYGNYDGLFKPPSFRLEIDGNFWANVTTSMSNNPVYHEILYINKREKVKVCLVREKDDEIPFISSLEAALAYGQVCPELIGNNSALYLHSRINYGANSKVQQSIGASGDWLNRIWRSKQMPNYQNIRSKDIPEGDVMIQNRPPWSVMAYAIQANNTTDSLYLSLDFLQQSSVQAYFAFYFMDPIIRKNVSEISRVDIYIDSSKMATLRVPRFSEYGAGNYALWLFPVQVVGSANVTISPANGSVLPPLLNAVEVFYAVDASISGDESISSKINSALPSFFLLLFAVVLMY